VGCPSERVQKGRSAPALMAEPAHAGSRCVEAMARGPCSVTVKARIGLDDPVISTPNLWLRGQLAGCARRRPFSGPCPQGCSRALIPKQNRTIAPLRLRPGARPLSANDPELLFELKCGLLELADCQAQLAGMWMG